MSDTTELAANNAAFLQSGLRWLRALLGERTRQHRPPVPAPDPVLQRGRSAWGFSRPVVPDVPLLAPPAPQTPMQAADELAAAAAVDPPPALIALGERFGLSVFERNILLLGAAMEIDPHLPALIAAGQDPSVPAVPNFALALDLFEKPSWDALAPSRPLRRHQLIEIHQSGAASLIAAPLRIDERIGAFIKGLNYIDERLLDIAECLSPPPSPLPASQQAAAARIGDCVAHGRPATVVALLGRDRASKREVAAAALAALGITLFEISLAVLPRDAAGVERFIGLWEREARLLPIALLVAPPAWDSGGSEPGDEAQPAVSWDWLLRLHGTILLDVSSPGPGLATHLIEVAPPTAAERRDLWSQAFPADGAKPDPEALERLAGEFALPASQISGAIEAAMLESGGTPDIDRLWTWCVMRAGGPLQGLADRIVPRARMDKVKLPARDREELDRLVRHARSRGKALDSYGFTAAANRGLGLAALFHGESGTGKTMAAEAVAQELRLALFRVDLASIMSKYIGETTKKLRAIFDAAEGGGVMLLFDEADAVFGKRSEVKDSHDRFANIDINYLLTRMEAFGGITVLATNMKHALDPAFLRRLRFVIGFGFPGAAEREAIWRDVFPLAEQTDALDFAALARFPLTGGSIFNTALGAAHEAAAQDAKISMAHVLTVIRAEFRKLERPMPERAFGKLRDVNAGAGQ